MPKTLSAADAARLEKQHALPAGWLQALLTLAQKIAPVLYNFIVDLLNKPPAPQAFASAGKGCSDHACCCAICVLAAKAIEACCAGDDKACCDMLLTAAMHCDPGC